MTTKNYDDSGSVSSPPEPRWYCLSIDATLSLIGDMNLDKQEKSK